MLLTFWSSADAQSRLDNMRYDRFSKDAGAHFVHVSVNMDRSMSVFNNTIVLDNLDRSAQFYSSIDVQDDIIKHWRLEDAYHSFLLDPDGVIVAVDPDEKTLAQLK